MKTSGVPDWMRCNPVSVHPFRVALRNGFEYVWRGLQTHDAATTCRRSRNDGPQSESRSNGLGMLLIKPLRILRLVRQVLRERIQARDREGARHPSIDAQLQAVILASEEVAEDARLGADDPRAEGHALLDVLQRRWLSGDRRVDERRRVEVVVADQLPADLADVRRLDGHVRAELALDGRC